MAAIFYIHNSFVGGQSIEHLWSISLEEQFYNDLAFFVSLIAFIPHASRRAWRQHIDDGLTITLHLWVYGSAVFYLRPWFRFDAIAVGCSLLPLPKAPKVFSGFSVAALIRLVPLYG